MYRERSSVLELVFTQSVHLNNTVYCGFATTCLARSLSAHMAIQPVANQTIYPLIRCANSPAYIIAQLYRASPIFSTTKKQGLKKVCIKRIPHLCEHRIEKRSCTCAFTFQYKSHNTCNFR